MREEEKKKKIWNQKWNNRSSFFNILQFKAFTIWPSLLLHDVGHCSTAAIAFECQNKRARARTHFLYVEIVVPASTQYSLYCVPFYWEIKKAACFFVHVDALSSVKCICWSPAWNFRACCMPYLSMTFIFFFSHSLSWNLDIVFTVQPECRCNGIIKPLLNVVCLVNAGVTALPMLLLG